MLKDLDRRRGPLNGVLLSDEARRHVEKVVTDVVLKTTEIAAALESLRYDRGDRVWRHECWTPEQRWRLKVASRLLMREIKRWVKRK